MLPTTMTIPAVLTSASGVVTSFGGLITLVVGLALGVAFVTFLIAKARTAKRG